MRAWQVAIVVVLAGLLGWGLVGFTRESRIVKDEQRALEEKVYALREENKELAARLEYLKDPRNLVKELKSQFNYRAEGEKLVIIVPDVATSTATTTLQEEE
jgi:cell division protein FtsB